MGQSADPTPINKLQDSSERAIGHGPRSRFCHRGRDPLGSSPAQEGGEENQRRDRRDHHHQLLPADLGSRKAAELLVDFVLEQLAPRAATSSAEISWAGSGDSVVAVAV